MNRLLADRREEKPIKMLYHKADKKTLTDDILTIKRDAYFKPKYSIAKLTKTTQERPQEFPGGFEDWFNHIRETHLKDLQEEKAKEKQRKQWLMTIEFDYAPKIMNRFMRVD